MQPNYQTYNNPPPTNPYYQSQGQNPVAQQQNIQYSSQQYPGRQPIRPQYGSSPPLPKSMGMISQNNSVLPGGYPDPKERPLPKLPAQRGPVTPSQQMQYVPPVQQAQTVQRPVQHPGQQYYNNMPIMQGVPKQMQAVPNQMQAVPKQMQGFPSSEPPPYNTQNYASMPMPPQNQSFVSPRRSPGDLPPPNSGQFGYYNAVPQQQMYQRQQMPPQQAGYNNMMPMSSHQMVYAQQSPQQYYMIVQQPYPGQPVQSARPPAQQKPPAQYAEARYEFNSEGGEFLCFKKGDRIEITGQEEDNYYRGINLRTDEEGIFPAKYVRMQ